MHLKISSARWRPFCPGRDELEYPSLHSGVRNSLTPKCALQWVLQSYLMCLIYIPVKLTWIFHSPLTPGNIKGNLDMHAFSYLRWELAHQGKVASNETCFAAPWSENSCVPFTIMGELWLIIIDIVFNRSLWFGKENCHHMNIIYEAIQNTGGTETNE